jgi:hypothetical protein
LSTRVRIGCVLVAAFAFGLLAAWVQGQVEGNFAMGAHSLDDRR